MPVQLFFIKCLQFHLSATVNAGTDISADYRSVYRLGSSSEVTEAASVKNKLIVEVICSAVCLLSKLSSAGDFPGFELRLVLGL